MNSRILILSLVIATIFTITLTETIQVSDALSGSATRLIYELKVGESQVLTWVLINTDSEPVSLELYATGEGSNLLKFEQYVTIEPHKRMNIDVIAVIPDDYLDNVELHPELFALQRSTSDAKSSGVSINVQIKTTPFIKIGDNPVYTQPTIVEKEKSDEKQITKINTPPPAPIETLEEKLARIAAANEANAPSVNTKTDKGNEAESITKTGETFTPEPIAISDDSPDGGGCLIATATYGTELAPQVQFLRELRDNTLLSTSTGTSFMTAFNQVYYTFSPSIADMERESPIFREAVKLVLTPMLSTLSIMTLAEDGSESQVMGLGISVIALNFAMYLAAPALIIHRLRK